MKQTLGEIAARFGLTLRGSEHIEITGLAAMADAGPGQLTFLFSSGYRQYLNTCRAAAVVLTEADSTDCPIPCLVSPQPRKAWAQIAALFDPAPVRPQGIHESAVVADDAELGEGVRVGPNVVIESAARIDAGSSIGPGSVIGVGAVVGENARIGANVSIYHGVTLGKRVIVHSGAVLGADGFGFEFDPETASLLKIPQIYGVVIGDDVEIGAGTTIDRGALNDTSIGDGVKLDNQVQVGHGTRIGNHTAISGCTAIAGSTSIGSYCLIGGAVGIIDNITVADRVEITAMSLVSQSIRYSGRYSSGTGLMPGPEWKRNIVGFRQLAKLLKRVRRLETLSRKE